MYKVYETSILHVVKHLVCCVSHHNLAAKYSVIGTLTHRAKTVCTGPELFSKEIQHLREALSKCKYPNGLWTWSKVSFLPATGRKVTLNKTMQAKGTTTQAVTPQKATSPKDKPSIGHIVIPYTRGLGESFEKICSKYGIQTHI